MVNPSLRVSIALVLVATALWIVSYACFDKQRTISQFMNGIATVLFLFGLVRVRAN